MIINNQAFEVLQKIAELCASDSNFSMSICHDFELGTGTLFLYDKHTHFGLGSGTDLDRVDNFINGLHNILCKNTGLSFVKD